MMQRRGGGCGCNMRTGWESSFGSVKQSGGGCGLLPQSGGGCGCSSMFKGGYKATRKNKKALRNLKMGKSIGFTMTASLKAKGLLARTSRKNRGKKIVGPKYR